MNRCNLPHDAKIGVEGRDEKEKFFKRISEFDINAHTFQNFSLPS